MAISKPVVAIVGRPNVGKSTLFNRLVEERRAIVEALPGTTRDRLYGDVSWRGQDFTLVDTGGLVPRAESDIARQVAIQVEMAVAEADVVVFIVDVRDGVTIADRDAAEMLRRLGKPVLLVANKVDNPQRSQDVVEFYALGLGEPLAISAYHNLGIDDLLDEVLGYLPAPTEVEEEPGLKVAIVGRPNVGKSQLLNAIIGEERVIVHESPGTTRDAIDTVFEHQGERLLLIDTAGIRRRGHIAPGIERYSTLRALRAIARADVALLVIDASEGITAQDAHIAGYVFDEYKGMVLVVNKWDLIEDEKKAGALIHQQLLDRLKFFPHAPVCFTSALLGQGIGAVLEAAKAVGRERAKQVEALALQSVFAKALAEHPPPTHGTKQLRIYSIAQEGVNPPTFVFTVNEVELVHFSYQRYLENRLRASFGFHGTPLRLIFRRRGRVRRSPAEAVP